MLWDVSGKAQRDQPCHDAEPELPLQAVLAAQDHFREKRKTPASRILARAKAAGMKAKPCRDIAEKIRTKTEALEQRYRGIRS